jgi:diaminopimelate epimerase
VGVAFAKGHGTENDFVLLADPDGRLRLTPTLVRALCDRHAGLGADGVLRLLRTAAAGDATPDSGAEWFMDYRNADGSIAEMCGNGARVFARYLVDNGLAVPGELVIGTRAGPRTVVVPSDGDITVEMGPAIVGGRSTAVVAGRGLPGLVIDVGNPHLVCVLEGGLDGLDLTQPPGHDPAVFPNGVNVEFVTIAGARSCVMRVHERGVGETRSCGTGTVAAAVAALREDGRDAGEYMVHTPGGPLAVRVGDASTWLTGPAVIVATGELTEQWWTNVEGENRMRRAPTMDGK